MNISRKIYAQLLERFHLTDLIEMLLTVKKVGISEGFDVLKVFLNGSQMPDSVPCRLPDGNNIFRGPVVVGGKVDSGAIEHEFNAFYLLLIDVGIVG